MMAIFDRDDLIVSQFFLHPLIYFFGPYAHVNWLFRGIKWLTLGALDKGHHAEINHDDMNSKNMKVSQMNGLLFR